MFKNKFDIFTIIISLVCICLYYFINLVVININQNIISYFVIGIVFIIIYDSIFKLKNDDIIKFNRVYLKFFYILTRIYETYLIVFSRKDGSATLAASLREAKYQIREGNAYFKHSKLLYVSINMGFIATITLLWHLLLVPKTGFIIVLGLLIFIFMIIIPYYGSLVSIGIKIEKTSIEKKKKSIVRTLILFVIVAMIIFIHVYLLFIKKVDSYNLFMIDIVLFCLIALLYRPIKIMYIKSKMRNRKNI